LTDESIAAKGIIGKTGQFGYRPMVAVRWLSVASLLLLALLLLSPIASVFAFSNGQAASLVLGQTDFTSSGAATTSTGLHDPNRVAFDSGSNLWVADAYNNRVLEYTTPFSTGEAASIVIGQSSFTAASSATTSTGLSGPYGVVFDSSHNLWVVDTANRRVLEYATPFSTGEAASIVIGQSSFTTSGAATTSTGLYVPVGVAFDSSGNLWVGDVGNNRVLRFAAAAPPPSTPVNPCQAGLSCYTAYAVFNAQSSGAPVGGATVVLSATGLASQSQTTSSAASTSALCTSSASWTAEWGTYWGCSAGETGQFTLEVGVTYSYAVTLPGGTVLTGSLVATNPWTVTIVNV
jgi:hypothetical protein